MTFKIKSAGVGAGGGALISVFGFYGFTWLRDVFFYELSSGF